MNTNWQSSGSISFLHSTCADKRKALKNQFLNGHKSMIFERLFIWGNANPRTLFLIDGFGALLSAILLGIILIKFETIFGIPKSTLYFLASLPCLFAIYDFYCFIGMNDKLSGSLNRIAIINLFYCCLSIGLAVFHRNQITYFGWTYILLEVLIIIALAIFELATAKSLFRKTNEDSLL